MIGGPSAATQYEIIYTDPLGNKLRDIHKYVSVEYARKVNDVGKMKVVLPENIYPESMFVVAGRARVDCRFEVWRKVAGETPKLDMETAWFLRNFYSDLDENGLRVYVIECVDGNDILKRRIIPYNEGNENLTADKVQEADDMMKAIVYENFGAGASDTDRDLSAYLDIQGDQGDAPILYESFSRKNVLSTMKEIADSSLENGTFLAFDTIYKPDSKKFEFRTYINQRGVDNTRSVTVGPNYGTMANVELEYFHENESNYIYCGGQSVGQIRSVKEVSNDDSIALSPFNRVELFVNASDTDDSGELTDAAYAALNANRANIIFTGELVDTKSVRYGKHYGFGDRILAEYKRNKYDVIVDAVSISISDAGESIKVSLKKESVL